MSTSNIITSNLSEYIYVAFGEGQWIELDEDDSDYYELCRCLKRAAPSDSSAELSAHGRVDRFMKHLSTARNRKGSPLRREFSPEEEGNLTWRCVRVGGQWLWLEGDWEKDLSPKLSCWDSDSDDGGDDGLRRGVRIEQEGDTSEDGSLEAVAEQVTVEPANATDHSTSRQAPGHPSGVSFGEFIVHEPPTPGDDDELRLDLCQDSFLDQGESEDRHMCLRTVDWRRLRA